MLAKSITQSRLFFVLLNFFFPLSNISPIVIEQFPVVPVQLFVSAMLIAAAKQTISMASIMLRSTYVDHEFELPLKVLKEHTGKTCIFTEKVLIFKTIILYELHVDM